MSVLTVEPKFVADCLGPTWQRNPTWDGRSKLSEYILPELTLGWQAIRWIENNLLNDEGLPFKLTREQTRFILWFYAINEQGRFIYRNVILQRLKGWGKDPLAACIASVEFIGPCRFGGWATVDMPEIGIMRGDPYGVENPRAWVEIAAVSAAQTVNTMAIFPSLWTDECKKAHGMNKLSIGKEVVYAHGGTRRIRAVTSNPRTLEGGRVTLVILNETHHWNASNSGHEMAEVIERNAVKAKDGAARTLSITNAYEPSEDSVAQRQREAYEDEAAGISFDTATLYDSLEAPASVKMTPEGIEYMLPEEQEKAVRAHLAGIVTAVRGDSHWLDVDGIVSSILRKTNPPSKMRRFWFNSITAAEDSWVEADAVDAAEETLATGERSRNADQLRAGWIVAPDDPIVVFFDGSKSNDATGLVGCRVSDGYVFTIGVWTKPPGKRGEGWLVPRDEVDNRVTEMFERFNIVMFWGDPSHTHDDDGSRYWDGLIDSWHRKFKDQLRVWSIKSGNNQHSVNWDMTSPERTKQFTGAAEQFVGEIETKDDDGFYTCPWKHDGHPLLKQHMKNARKSPNGYGVSMSKANRQSLKKIDLAVCAVGARMMQRIYLNVAEEDKAPEAGTVWGVYD